MPPPFVWLPLSNETASPIPSFGVATVTGQDDDGNLLVGPPDADNDAGVIVLGAGAMPAGGTGNGTFDPFCVVLYDERDGVPAPREVWGVKSGEHRLRKDKTGFVILGGASEGLVNAVRVPPAGAGGPSDGDTAAGDCNTGCGSLGSLAADACLKLTLVCATGSFADIDTDQFAAVYAFGSGGVWTFKKWVPGSPGAWTTVTLDWLGGTGSAVFTWNGTPLPSMTLGGTSLTPTCLGATATFSANPRNGVTGDPAWTPDGSCPSNELILKVECSCCPPDEWEGAGIYCADRGDGCEVLTLAEADICDAITICSGPYDTEEEAAVGDCAPVPTAPCQSADMTTATATYSNKTGDCTCLPTNPTVSLRGTDALRITTASCPGNIQLDLACSGGFYALTTGTGGIVITLVSFTASPFVLVYDITGFGGNCGGSGGSARLTIAIP